MQWLIDCEKTAAPLPLSLAPMSAPLVPARSVSTTVTECGERLVPVAGLLAVLPVYRILGLDGAPEVCLLRSGVLARLQQANVFLPPEFALVVLDGWRPLQFQRTLLRYYETLLGRDVAGYVADPRDVIAPSHVTGGAVDLTLKWREAPLALGTDFDDLSPPSAPAAYEHPSSPERTKHLRRLLADVMIRAGFVVNPLEWWHWSYGDYYWAASVSRPGVYDEVSVNSASA